MEINERNKKNSDSRDDGYNIYSVKQRIIEKKYHNLKNV